MTPSVTYCPSANAHSVLQSEPQFFKPRTSPVTEAAFDSEGCAHTSGVAFEDRLSRLEYKLAGHRKQPAPDFAFNDARLRELLVVFWETRAGIHVSHWPNGDARQRLAIAQEKLATTAPVLLAALRRLCVEYVGCSDLKRKATLAKQISNLDTRLRLVQRGPAVAAAVAIYFWRDGLTSVECASLLKLRPQHVRQLLRRLVVTYKKFCPENG